MNGTNGAQYWDLIENKTVQVYSPAKAVLDLFRYRQRQDRRYEKSRLRLAIEEMDEALRVHALVPKERRPGKPPLHGTFGGGTVGESSPGCQPGISTKPVRRM
jgi:hypothetical protein